jgi:hypothetical protein
MLIILITRNSVWLVSAWKTIKKENMLKLQSSCPSKEASQNILPLYLKFYLKLQVFERGIGTQQTIL